MKTPQEWDSIWQQAVVKVMQDNPGLEPQGFQDPIEQAAFEHTRQIQQDARKELVGALEDIAGYCRGDIMYNHQDISHILNLVNAAIAQSSEQL